MSDPQTSTDQTTRPDGDSPHGAGLRGPERFVREETVEREGSAGKAALAALGLLLLLVGFPIFLLLTAGAPPIPTSLPDRADLTQPIGVDLILGVLLIVVWLAWLQFAVCTVVEVVGFVRGGGLPTVVPLSGPTQALARALVGTVLVGTALLSGTGAASAATAVDTGAQTGSQAVSSQIVQTEQSGHEAGAEAPGGSATAETAPETGPGSAASTAEAPVQRMVPVPGVPAEMTDVIGHKVTIVQPPKAHYHDNLWDIAERHLGEGRRWKEIFDLNQGRVQPDGGQLVLGRLIQPGWVLMMPEDAVGAQRVRAETAPAPAAAPVSQLGASDTGADAAAAEAVATPDSSLPGDLATGGLLAASVLGALVLERRRRRGRGPDPDAVEAEVALRVGADEDRATWLDAALRSLSAACRFGAIALPPVYAARVGDDSLELRIAGEHQQTPAGWRVEDDGRRWVLDRNDTLPTERGHAPYPGLVCLGRDDDGFDVLVDLESADGVVSIEGAPAIAREVVSALAVQLATVPWSDQQSVLGHDLNPSLRHIGQQGIELVDDLDTALSDLEGAGGQPAQQVLSGRLGRSAGVAPRYLMLGAAPQGSAEDRLGALTREGMRGLGVVTVGTVRSSRWRATITDAGRLALPLLDVEVEAVRLGHDSAELLADLFDDARDNSEDDRETRPTIPPTAAGAGDDSAWSSAAVRVGVLGSLELRVRGEIDPARRELATELVTFLALQTEPVHPSVLGASVWPMGVTPEVRDATVSRVRDWVGTDVDGNHLVRETDNGRLYLATDAAVDWQAFCELIRRARTAGEREEPELLRRALQLVRGPLLDGVPARRYSWVPRTHVRRMAHDLVIDTAHRLAEISHQDPPGAAASARAGLRLAPDSQLLWRDLLSAAHRAEDASLASAAAEEMLARLQELRVPLEAETEALLEELLPAQREDLA